MKQLATDLITALDPVEFAKTYLDITPDPWQVRVLKSASKRIILCCSRQSGKTTVTAIAALHYALYHPNSLILICSASQRQSKELFQTVKGMLAKYQQQIGERSNLLEDNKLEAVLGNGSRIVSLPASEKTIRGFSSVDLLIEDEASRVDDSVFTAISPMLAVSGGKLIMLSTPWGRRGHFWSCWNEPSWEKYQVTAEECPRITKQYLEEERRRIGDYYFEQEFFCQFKDLAGSMFSHEEIANAINPELEMAEL